MDDKFLVMLFVLLAVSSVGVVIIVFFIYRTVSLLSSIERLNRQILDRSTGTYQAVSTINERQRLDGRISAEAADDLRDVLVIIRDLKEKGVIK